MEASGGAKSSGAGVPLPATTLRTSSPQRYTNSPLAMGTPPGLERSNAAHNQVPAHNSASPWLAGPAPGLERTNARNQVPVAHHTSTAPPPWTLQ